MNLKTLRTRFLNDLSFLYPNEEIEALFLIAVDHFLKMSRTEVLLNINREIIDTEKINFEELLVQLKTGKPIQYCLGETIFYGLPFKVNPSVLIPRPETEELVEWILEKVDHNKLHTLADIGTGSGCIAIALKQHLPNSVIYAFDIAEESLKTAKTNADLNNLAIKFIEADILKWDALTIETQFSVIVSNPPYVTEDEKLTMHKNVLANEPHRALFVSNQDPLIFYDAIANFALKNLQKNGFLFFEINEYLAKQTIELLNDKSFINIELRKDMQGKDRMICCQMAD
jgi:release factor glutamine methyltransferase